MCDFGLVEPMTLKREQLKGARAILGLTVREVADLSGVAPNTISRYENGYDALGETLDKIQTALESAGIDFPDNATIRFTRFLDKRKQ